MLGNNGAGVYGGVTDTEATITGAYAGYFNGNTAVVNGLLSARVISLGPAVKIDSFIPIRKEQVIADLSQLQPVAYYRRQVEVPMDSTNTEGEVVHYSIPRYDESSPAFRHKQYGLIAEDVQKVYPDMVYETPDGLAIDYVGLVPVLLQAVRSQQAAINAIQQQLDAV